MMTPDEWRRYLQMCSDELLKEPLTPNGPTFNTSVRQSRWFGYGPAAHGAIKATEQRLGIALPPSLRAFYSVTNGWGIVGYFVWEVMPVEKVGWLKDLAPDLFTSENIIAQELSAYPTDEEFRNDIDTQYVRVNRTLVLSQVGDSSTWLLDPGMQNQEGEWAAGRWSSWNPAMRWIADSFEGLFRDEFETYLNLRDR